MDGAHDLDEEALSEKDKKILKAIEKEKVISPAEMGELLLPEQEYHKFPARYKQHVQWSITGACNMNCRHCFMSAPQAKHGNPTHEQLMNIVDQLAECGVFRVGLTGGEPLIRSDFMDIICALTERDIMIQTIYTNGRLVDEKLLDTLEKTGKGRKIPFQLSFDGIHSHDYLRGIPGSEQKTIQVLKLLQSRGYPVSVSFCLHRKNLDTVRDSVKLMASLGVKSMKIGSMMPLGEWASPEIRRLHLTREEQFSFFERYIPEYFEDGAPLAIVLSGIFAYVPGDGRWRSFFERKVPLEKKRCTFTCPSMQKGFYIGPEGMVAPCMGMADCGYAVHFPNLFETPLKEILGNSELMHLCNATVAEVHGGNVRCERCEFKGSCSGGCRNTALISCDSFYGPDEEACWYFENNGPARIRAAAEDAFDTYLRSHPPAQRSENSQNQGTMDQECP